MKSGLVVTLLVTLLAAPLLFVGLDNRELGNDEAIYAFVIERMHETGDWLTCHNPYGGLFHEKPPLKFWMAAAGLDLGLPVNEIGMRLWDTVLGLAGLLYVAAFGRRIGGTACALGAVAVLLVDRALLFDHGLRSGNMESMLFVAYAGGAWHFVRWAEGRRGGASLGHAFAVAGWFAFAFLGKWLAAVFLPPTLLAAALLHSAWRRRLGQDLGRWLGVAAAAVAVIAPWFVYARLRFGHRYFEVLWGDHVLERFTGYLEAHHLRPWWFYLEGMWHGLAETWPFVVAGVALWVLRAADRSRGEVKLAALWLLLPLVPISAGTSKLYHYVYPFLPPLALAGGTALAAAWQLLDRAGAGAALARRRAARPRVTGAALVLIAACGAAFVATLVSGPLQLATPFGLLKSSSLTRPLWLAGLVGAWLVGRWRAALAILLVAGFVAATATAYRRNLEEMWRVRAPTRERIECIADRVSARPTLLVDLPQGLPIPNTLHHYARHRLQIERPHPPDRARALVAIETGAAAVLMTASDHAAHPAIADVPGAREHDFVLVLPGAYSPCAGGTPPG